MITLPRNTTFVHEPCFQPPNPNRRTKDCTGIQRIIDLLFAGCVLALASCAWIETHKAQLTAISEVALSHIAQDAYEIGLATFANELDSGFSTDLGYALQQNARDQLPTILSSNNLGDYLKAWNSANTNALAALVPAGLDASSAQKVALVIVDSQAAAIPAAIVTHMGLEAPAHLATAK